MLRRLPSVLLLLSACRTAPTAARPSLYGTWEKAESTLPPVSLVVRRTVEGDQGELTLSGVRLAIQATLTDTSIVLADPVSSKPAVLVAVLQKDGTLRARLDGNPPYETTLVRRKLND